MALTNSDKHVAKELLKELHEIERWLAHAEISTSDDYSQACQRSIQLRQALGLPERE